MPHLSIQTASTVPTRRVVTSTHEAGMVFLDIDHGHLFTANRVGTAIWQQLAKRVGIDDIATRLSLDHGVPVEVAKADTLRFVSQLSAHNLV